MITCDSLGVNTGSDPQVKINWTKKGINLSCLFRKYRN